jgi:hypothetical protein
MSGENVFKVTDFGGHRSVNGHLYSYVYTQPMVAKPNPFLSLFADDPVMFAVANISFIRKKELPLFFRSKLTVHIRPWT